MDVTDKIYDLHGILSAARTPVSRGTLQERLECSRATLTRTFAKMRQW